MTLPVVTSAVLLSTAATATFEHSTEVVVAVAALIAALGAIWKALRFGPAIREIREFLQSWNGSAASAGVDAVPGLPERVAYLGTQLHEIKGRDSQLAIGIEELTAWAKSNGDSIRAIDHKVDRIDERVINLDSRVTDHRKRNEQQTEALKNEVIRRAEELELRVTSRDAIVDERFDHISEDLLRAETMRAALMELGLDIEPPRPMP